jgi:hypothetical protein
LNKIHRRNLPSAAPLQECCKKLSQKSGVLYYCSKTLRFIRARGQKRAELILCPAPHGNSGDFSRKNGPRCQPAARQKFSKIRVQFVFAESILECMKPANPIFCQQTALSIAVRRRVLVIALISLIALPLSLRAADDQKSTARPNSEATKTASPEKQTPQKSKTKKNSTAGSTGIPANRFETIETGSHLKQKIKRNGRITDGASQVIVIDRQDIERSGASTVTQLLRKYPAIIGP